jgi:hypothetical protein
MTSGFDLEIITYRRVPDTELLNPDPGISETGVTDSEPCWVLILVLV